MVHVLPVVAVVVGAFLVAVGRIVCRIEVQEHTLWSFILLAPLPDVELQESLGHPVAVADANRVLQAREGGLACEVLLSLRQPAACQLQKRIGAQRVGVVLVLVARGYLQDALLDERHQRVTCLPAAPLRHMLGDLLAQSELLIYLRKPGEPAVGGYAPTVEGGFESERGGGFKAHPGCGRILHEGASFSLVSFGATRPYTGAGSLFSTPSVNNSGLHSIAAALAPRYTVRGA